jgi:hypothetical protein
MYTYTPTFKVISFYQRRASQMDSLVRDKVKYQVGQIWRVDPSCVVYEYSWMTDSRVHHPLLNGGCKLIIKALWRGRLPAMPHAYAQVIIEDGSMIDVELYELCKCILL